MRIGDENLILLGMLKSLAYIRLLSIKAGDSGLLCDLMDQLETGILHRLSKITYLEFKPFLTAHKDIVKMRETGLSYLTIPISKDLREALKDMARKEDSIEEYVAYKLLKNALKNALA